MVGVLHERAVVLLGQEESGGARKRSGTQKDACESIA